MTDLVGLERAAYARTAGRVGLLVDALIARVGKTLVENSNAPGSAVSDAIMTSRLAAAAASIFADPDLLLSADEATKVAVVAADIVRLFHAAGLGGPDFLLASLGQPAGVPASVLARRSMLLSLDSTIEWPASLVTSLPPRQALLTLVQLLSNKPVMTMHGQARREALLSLAAQMAPADFPRTPDHLVLLTNAWMICSYAASADKHRVKILINQVLKQMARGWNFTDPPLPASRTQKERPLLMFASEIMHSRHVQYRYFGQYLRQLRTRFELVLLTEAKEVDDYVRSLFDRVLTFERGKAQYLADIRRMIVETAPDILFYPSVGMRHWGPLFANMRLAPIQITALGHSASTFCSTIDYYLLEEGYVSDPALFGETVITVPDDSLIFERMPEFTSPAPEIRSKPTILRIVLPSNVLKLNPGFLATIGRIAKAASRPVEFHFLPNASGMELDVIRRTVGQYVPNAHVHGMLSYERYLALVSSGDLNLSPFPFGGLHSVVDSLRQGVPVVAMECPEPHGRTDAMLLRRLGMPEWLITTDEEGYVAAALRVIEDDALRVQLSEQAMAIDVGTIMFGDDTTPLRSEIVDAMWWIYQNHEAAQGDGRKLWSMADRATFAAG